MLLLEKGKINVYAVYCVCNNTYNTVTITLFLYMLLIYNLAGLATIIILKSIITLL